MLFKEALSVGVTPLSRILVLFCRKIGLIFFLALRIGIAHPNKNDIDGALRTSGPISIALTSMGVFYQHTLIRLFDELFAIDE